MSFLFDFSLPRLHSTRDPSSADGTDDEAGAFSFGHARKRKRLGATMTEDVTGDGPGTNEMPDRHSRTRGLENPSGTGRRREEGFQHHPIVSDHPMHERTEAYSKGEEEEEEEEGLRKGKRHRAGTLETLISTVISVAIIIAAAGYTAYRLWKDRIGSSGVNGDEKQKECIEGQESRGQGASELSRKGFVDGCTREGTIRSPPPPYHAGGDKGRRECGAYGQNRRSDVRGYRSEQPQPSHARSSAGRPPTSQVQPTVDTLYGTGEKTRKAEDEDLFSGHGSLREHRTVTKRNQPQPSRAQSHVVSNEEGRAQEGFMIGDEGFEDERRQLEEQMEWMSNRLQQLIADGKRALEGEKPMIPDGDETAELGKGQIPTPAW